MSFLQITDRAIIDDSVRELQYHEYEPGTGTNLNNPGEIRINIETQDLFTLPAESFLQIEGQLQKTDGTTYADADVISLTNNGIMFLFDSLKYQLSGQEIEYVLYPGQATTMLGLLKYSDDFAKSQGLNQLWFKDTGTNASVDAAVNTGFSVRHSVLIKKPAPKGTFSFAIPLKHVFGFCEDYEKVVYGVKHTLTLIRSSDDNAIFRLAAAGAGKVVLSKIAWFIPHVEPNDEAKMELYKIIENKTTLEVAYRLRQCDTITVPGSTSFSWRLTVKSAPEKPRYVIVGFQTDKDSNQERNPALFDHCNVANMHVMLNSVRYPVIDFNSNFAQQKYSRMYKEAADFKQKFFGIDPLMANSNLNPTDYKELFPLFVFDVSKQSEKLKNSVTDITVKATFSNNVPAGTQAFAVVISDRIIQLQSDGHKLNVVF